MSFRNNLKKSALKLRLSNLQRQGQGSRPRPLIDRLSVMRNAREGQVPEGAPGVAVAAQMRSQNGPIAANTPLLKLFQTGKRPARELLTSSLAGLYVEPEPEPVAQPKFKCSICGVELLEESRFCPGCGVDLSEPRRSSYGRGTSERMAVEI